MLTIPDEAPDGVADESVHVVRFYEHDASLLDEVAEFIDCALRAGGTGLVIATPPHVAHLRRRLSGLGSSSGAPSWYPGRLVVLDAEETLDSFMVDGIPDRERFRAAIQPRCRATARTPTRRAARKPVSRSTWSSRSAPSRSHGSPVNPENCARATSCGGAD